MILSLDASLTCTGFCVMDKKTDTILEIGKITTKKGKLTEPERILYIVNYIRDIVEKYSINDVAIEDQFLQRNPKTTMQLSRLRGALEYMLMDKGCNVENLAPSSVRKLMMGDGSVDKEEVAKYIQDKYKDDDKVVDLGEFCDRQCKAKNSDIFDAIAIALALKHII